MKLLPAEADVFRYLLTGSGPAPDLAALADSAARLAEEAPPLGEHVFRLECLLGTDARKLTDANTKARKSLREELGVKRLGKGQGPPKVTPLSAPTMNEYNGLNPWQKEALRKEYDAAIGELRANWPRWSCGVVERTVQGPKKPRVVKEGGRRRAIVLTRESSVRPDELALDAVGGKIPVDRLVHAGVLRGDTLAWLVRYVVWRQVAPGEGRVVVDVYDLAG